MGILKSTSKSHPTSLYHSHPSAPPSSTPNFPPSKEPNPPLPSLTSSSQTRKAITWPNLSVTALRNPSALYPSLPPSLPLEAPPSSSSLSPLPFPSTVAECLGACALPIQGAFPFLATNPLPASERGGSLVRAGSCDCPAQSLSKKLLPRREKVV